MEEHGRTPHPVTIMVLTGLAFAAGGLFRSLAEWLLGLSGYSESILPIALTIWTGFMAEAAVGMAVLSSLLRDLVPFHRLYRMGLGAFAIGILIGAFTVNQFFMALLLIPGFFVGLSFAFLAGRGRGRGILFGMVLLGFALCQLLFISVWGNDAISIWLSELVGPFPLMFLMNALMDFLIGSFVALGVYLMLRRRDREGNPHPSP